jgi:hypothetical protein
MICRAGYLCASHLLASDGTRQIRAAPIRENIYPMVVNKRLQRVVRIYAYAARSRGIFRCHARDFTS